MTPFHPLLQQLADRPGCDVIDTPGLAGFLARGGPQVLFFSGDPVRFPEALDVAVVLPELRAAGGVPFTIGVVARDHEGALARRFGQQRWPTLVCLRDGEYLGATSGMQDWDVFRHALAALWAAAPQRVPGVGIPVVDARGAAATGCA